MATENIGGEGHVCGSGHCGGDCCGGNWHKHGRKGVFVLLALAGALYLLALAANTIAEHQYIGRDVNAQTTITVSGDGDSYATPDIATVSFAITQEEKNSVDARKMVDAKMKKIHDFLAGSGVLDKDVKTTGYNLYPKYDYVSTPCVLDKMTATQSLVYPCGNSKQVLKGYEVSQSVEVKIRNLDDAGKVLGGLSDNGATNLSGLSFLVEHEDAVEAQAREAAIGKAKAKAVELAKTLGVSLVRIVSFNEGNNYPIYYGRGGMVKAMSADAGAPTPADIPRGENKYTSNVTIVYEIR